MQRTPILLCTLILWAAGAAAQDLAELEPGTELLGHRAARGVVSPWMRRQAEEHPAAGPRQGPAWVLSAAPAGDWSHIGLQMDPAVIGRQLSFAIMGRGSGGELRVNAFAYDAEGEVLDRRSDGFLISEARWEESLTTYVLPPGTVRWTLWVVNQSGRECRVANPSLILGADARAQLTDLAGPGVLEARARSTVAPGSAGQGTVSFPIPLLTEHQVPLTFDLDVQPPEALLGFRWIEREDGVNWLCEVEVAPPAEGATVGWRSLVLVDARDDERDLPRKKAAEAPRHAAPWLASTAVVQSDEPRLASRARALRSGTKHLQEFVEAVLAFTSSNPGTGEPFLSLDALSALGCGGSCTSRAQLAAALLRAEGVPARTSAHLPTWSGPLYEHWHVEYWHPGAGWTWIEPTLGRLRPQPYSLVVLNVAWPADEDQGFDEVITHSGVMPGVPRHAVHEHSPELAVAAPADGVFPFNAATVALPLAEGDDRRGLFSAARQAWLRLRQAGLEGRLVSGREEAVREAVEAYDVKALVKALKRRHR